MTSVLAGFAVIAIIIAAGWLLGRLGVLGEQPEKQLSLLVFYLLMTCVSQRLIDRLSAWLSRGQATMAGESMRKAGAAA